MEIIFEKKNQKNNEFWLEFGRILPDGWTDMFWYNEGRHEVFPYFVKQFFRFFFTPRMYFLIRYRGFSFYLRGKKKICP